jgi:hypothetical protein
MYQLSNNWPNTHEKSPLYGTGNVVNPLNAELNPIRHLLALAEAHHFVHVSSIRVKEKKDDAEEQDEKEEKNEKR